MSALISVTQDRGSGTSIGSTKPFCCRKIFNGNRNLSVYLNPLFTVQNGLMTLIPPTEQTPTESKLVQ